MEEYRTGPSTLPPQYALLFNNTVEHILTQDLAMKKKWLASIWSAEERHNNTHLYRDPSLQRNLFYLRWRLQADPDRAREERMTIQRQQRGTRRTSSLQGRQPQRFRTTRHWSDSI